MCFQYGFYNTWTLTLLYYTSRLRVSLPTHFCSVFCKNDILKHANYIFLMVFRILVFYFLELLNYGCVLRYASRLPFIFLSHQMFSLKGSQSTYTSSINVEILNHSCFVCHVTIQLLTILFSLCASHIFSACRSCCLSIWQSVLKH